MTLKLSGEPYVFFSKEPKLYARMIIRNKEGKFLILKNIKDGRNRWEFPGGKQEPGEVLPTTAVRETQEETGIKATVLRFIAEREIYVESENWKGEFWLAEQWIGEPSIKEPTKFSQMRWVTSEEFAGLAQIPRVGVDLTRLIEEEDRIRKISEDLHHPEPHHNS